jgi:hypothetical protein
VLFDNIGHPGRIMLAIGLIAILLAVIQNVLMFTFGLKESAIFSSPLSFGGVFLAELFSIGAGYFWVRRCVRNRRRLVLAAWMIAVLGAAELELPVSSFGTLLQHSKRERVLSRIERVKTEIEPLASGRGGTRFALTYTLKFPQTARYLTFPAWLGPSADRLFGDYFMKVHPEYYDENHVFEAGTPYSFTVVFDTGGGQFDFSREAASIDICDGKDYFMACRIIAIPLDGVPAALAAHPSPASSEPTGVH